MITVLRLGHRKERDKRISTHCGLTARAFGAEKIIYSGERDKGLLKSVNSVTERWGGPFKAVYEKNWRKVIQKFKGVKVHLSFYGEDFEKVTKKIKNRREILVIVGGEKVPWEVYQMADFNAGVGNQPHSEVAALAVFLNEIKGVKKNFKKAKIKIMPCKRGKIVKPC